VTAEKKPKVLGRLRRAPENFVTQQFADDVYENGLNEERRGFLRKSFVTALGAATAGGAVNCICC
jgi:sulfane dehydrogenase subunit SoxC